MGVGAPGAGVPIVTKLVSGEFSGACPNISRASWFGLPTHIQKFHWSKEVENADIHVRATEAASPSRLFL